MSGAAGRFPTVTSDDHSDRATPPATAGMGGKGFYDHHSEAQSVGIRQQAARLRIAVRHLDLSPPELRIVDYGCGPGRNSTMALRTILDEVRRRAPQLPVVAVHNDQIGNDWNDLFANISGPNGYLHDVARVRAEASVGSFFGPVASPGTVDLGISFGASHWLARPVRIASPGSLFFCDLPEPARGEVAAIAARDWTDFLKQRAGEMKSGGWLVVDGLASVPDPDDPSGVCAAGRGLYRALWQVAAKLAGEGRIDSARLEAFVFPVYFRLADEVRTPFGTETDVSDAFDVVELTVESLPSPYEEALAGTGGAKAYASAYAGFARAFAESTLRGALFQGSTADSRAADELTDAFFGRLRDLFADEPGRHPFEHLVMTLVLRRR
jgi:SAM-dependent methyltransferase